LLQDGVLSALPFIGDWISITLCGLIVDRLLNAKLMSVKASRKLLVSIGEHSTSPIVAEIIHYKFVLFKFIQVLKKASASVGGFRMYLKLSTNMANSSVNYFNIPYDKQRSSTKFIAESQYSKTALCSYC
jgi:hypothetical protein